MFYGLNETEFFIFPIHQIQLDRNSSFTTKRDKELKPPILVLSNQSDILTCQFRDFIYTLFAPQEEIEHNLLQTQKLNQILDILSNVISHANNNSESETKRDIQHHIMRSVLTEQYIRENPASLKILKEVFDVDNFDGVFGTTGRESHNEEDSTPAMSKCFLHSEQAYLNRLFSEQINIKDFIIACMYEAISKNSDLFSIEPLSTDSSTEILLPTSSGVIFTASKGELAFEDDEEEQEEEKTKTNTFPSHKKNKANASKNSLPKGKERMETKSDDVPPIPPILQFHFESPIIIDIISPRHICKYCRGSFYLRFDQIKSLFGQHITIIPMERKKLNSYYSNKGILTNIITKEDIAHIMGEGNLKPSDDTHSRLYTYCNDRRHSHREYANFVLDYQKFKLYQFLDQSYPYCKIDKNFVIRLQKLNIEILATSFKKADENIIG